MKIRQKILIWVVLLTATSPITFDASIHMIVSWKARRSFHSFLSSSQAQGYLKEQLLSSPCLSIFFVVWKRGLKYDSDSNSKCCFIAQNCLLENPPPAELVSIKLSVFGDIWYGSDVTAESLESGEVWGVAQISMENCHNIANYRVLESPSPAKLISVISLGVW